MIGVNDKTAGHLVGPDGSLVTLPTTLMGADTAQIMRAYFVWAMSNQLEPELFCSDCYDRTRGSKAIYNITEAEIQIVCDCQLRAFFGHTLPPNPVAASQTQVCEGEGSASVLLSEEAARLLRLYKKVLIDLGLKEALRCNACYELKQSDGCMAQVTTNSIRILCRCSNRSFVGMTI